MLNQINFLVREGAGLLRAGLKDLELDVETPVQFIEAAKQIVTQHTRLERRTRLLEEEVESLEVEQQDLLMQKEEELLQDLSSRYSGHDPVQLRQLVRQEISAVLDFPGRPLSSPFTLTKFNGNNNTATYPDSNFRDSKSARSNTQSSGQPTLSHQPMAYNQPTLHQPMSTNEQPEKSVTSSKKADGSHQTKPKPAPGKDPFTKMSQIIEHSVRNPPVTRPEYIFVRKR